MAKKLGDHQNDSFFLSGSIANMFSFITYTFYSCLVYIYVVMDAMANLETSWNDLVWIIITDKKVKFCKVTEIKSG